MGMKKLRRIGGMKGVLTPPRRNPSPLKARVARLVRKGCSPIAAYVAANQLAILAYEDAYRASFSPSGRPAHWKDERLFGRLFHASTLYKVKTTYSLYHMLNSCGTIVSMKQWNRALAGLAEEGAEITINSLEWIVVARTWLGLRIDARKEEEDELGWHPSEKEILAHKLVSLLRGASQLEKNGRPELAAFIRRWKSAATELVDQLYPIFDELEDWGGSWEGTPRALRRRVDRSRAERIAQLERMKELERAQLLENFHFAPHEEELGGLTFSLLHPLEYSEEGTQMRHCLGKHTGQGLAGTYKVYRIQDRGQGRWTLGLIVFDNGTVSYDQLFGRCNETAPDAVHDAARALIDRLNENFCKGNSMVALG